MSKTICIFPQDYTTDFLRPLCNYICKEFNATEIAFDTTSDDDPHEVIYKEIKEAQNIFFLGHGRSDCLFASIIDNDPIIDRTNITLLYEKRLFLLACRSNEFINKFHLSNAIGFGFLPTSMDDISRSKLHNLDISHETSKDIDCFKNALIKSLMESLSPETILDFHLFKERFKFNVNRQIIDCLTSKKASNYRLVADELYYLYKDMYFSERL